MNRNFILWIFIIFMTATACEQPKEMSDEEREMESFIDSLLTEMTLEEKVGQMNQYTSRWEMTGPAPANVDSMFIYNMVKEGKLGSMLNVTGANATRRIQEWAVDSSRMGIPLILAYDVIHGFKTMFPIPLAEAASWDPEMAKLSSSIAATEASAAGLHWTFAPMVDVARDARWGRIMEGAGEDPYLGAQMAYARVKGFQGDDLSQENTIAACAKHFAGYGFAEAGRDYNTVDISEFTLRNIVLPPFKACVDAGVATFMNSFNTLNGTPATANAYLVREILKGEWDFNGFVVSDWNSVGELIPHGVAADKKDAAELAVIAGCDMDMEGNVYIESLMDLVKKGEVQEFLIDDAVRRILRIKYKLGLFDDPYKYSDAEREKTMILNEQNLEASREVAKRSIVLLKNENQMLPLSKSGQRIAVIGELAESKDVPLGSWRAQAVTNSAVSMLEGIENAVIDAQVKFAKGPDYVTNERSFTSALKFNTNDRSGIQEAKAVASGADVVVIALGEDAFQTGEGRSQVDISLKGLQQELLEEVYSVNKNVVVVLMNGRPLEINWMAENVPAIVEAWHLGSEAGSAIADVLFGDYNPSGKLPVSFPRSVGQMPMSYSRLNTGRPEGNEDLVFWSHYTDERNDALYPFGYGLSYTTFKYSDLQLSEESFSPKETITATVTVKNTGNRTGEEVVQLYVRDLVGTLSRPLKELKGFEKIELKPGESKKVEFEITIDKLAFYGTEDKWQAEPGKFKLWIGPNSAEGLEADFVLL